MQGCRICGNAAGNSVHRAPETGFGSGELFDYLECAACGCLQLSEIPVDLSKYYPDEYYSYATPQPAPDSALARFLKLRRTAYCLGACDPLGRLVARRQGIPAHLDWMRRMRLRTTDPILDVGCGAGELLLHLRSLGFRNLHGIDPYLPQVPDYGRGLRIERQRLAEAQGAYALVMLNHVLEHLPSQLDAVQHAQRLLRPGGWLLLRLPLTGTHAWRTYGVMWAQLDPPRHLYLHSERSLRLLAGQAGLAVREVLYDSTAFQFWGSEQNRQGIPLYSDRSWLRNPAAAPFTQEQISNYDKQAAELNTAADGDQACFMLQRA